MTTEAILNTRCPEVQAGTGGVEELNVGVIPRLVRLAEVTRMLAVSQRHVYRLIQRGNFPKPVKIGGAVRFVADDILEYVESQRDKRA